MDEIDQRLIAALRADARSSHASLAASLGITRATVRARIEKLEARGDILGYTVRLRDDAQGDPVRGLMMIGIEGRGTERILRQLTGLPEVRALHSTNGRWDVIAEIGTPSLEAFDTALNRIRKLDGVSTSETSLLLSAKK